MSLGESLHNAVTYAVAKAAAGQQIKLEDDAVDAISVAAVVTVLEELASREEWIREATPRDEMGHVKDGLSLRIMEYQSAASELRADKAPS